MNILIDVVYIILTCLLNLPIKNLQAPSSDSASAIVCSCVKQNSTRTIFVGREGEHIRGYGSVNHENNLNFKPLKVKLC